MIDIEALGKVTDSVVPAAVLEGRDPGFDKTNFDAGVAVRPVRIEDLRNIVLWCASNRVPLVPQGGRTGLAGGAASHPGELILMLDRLNRIEEIDTSCGVAIVQAGVTLEALEEAVRAEGFSAGIDLAARGSCTIGGMVSTNAGGIEAFDYGVMRHRVIGLEAVLADGTVMSDLKRVIKANEGYDVKQLFIGAEGTLGAVTRVAVRLVPAGQSGQTALLALGSAADAVTVFQDLRRAATARLRGCEIMWRAYAETVAEAIGLARIPAFTDAPVLLIVELEGCDVEGLGELLASHVEAGRVLDALVAMTEQERLEIWSIREESEALDRAMPHGYWYDVSIPLGDLDAYVASAADKVAAIDPEMRFYAYGHLGDGNLHLTVSKGEPAEGLYEAFSEALCAGLAERGGSFSAEHGIGTEKMASLGKYGDPGKREMMKRIKRALDPDNLMNPGKLIDPAG